MQWQSILGQVRNIIGCVLGTKYMIKMGNFHPWEQIRLMIFLHQQTIITWDDNCFRDIFKIDYFYIFDANLLFLLLFHRRFNGKMMFKIYVLLHFMEGK